MATKDDSKPVNDGAHLFANNADQSDPFQALSSNTTQTAREHSSEPDAATTTQQSANANTDTKQAQAPAAPATTTATTTTGEAQQHVDDTNKPIAGDASTLFGGDDSNMDALFGGGGGGNNNVSGADTLFSQPQQPTPAAAAAAADSLFAQAQPTSDPFFNGQYDNGGNGGAAYQYNATDQQYASYTPQQQDQHYNQYTAQDQQYTQYAPPHQYGQEHQYSQQQQYAPQDQYAGYAQDNNQYQQQQQQQQGYAYDAYANYQYQQDAYSTTSTYQQIPNYQQQPNDAATGYSGYDPQQYAQNYQYVDQQSEQQYMYDPQSAAYQQQPSNDAMAQYAYDPQQVYDQQQYQVTDQQQQPGVMQNGQDMQAVYQSQQQEQHQNQPTSEYAYAPPQQQHQQQQDQYQQQQPTSDYAYAPPPQQQQQQQDQHQQQQATSDYAYPPPQQQQQDQDQQQQPTSDFAYAPPPPQQQQQQDQQQQTTSDFAYAPPPQQVPEVQQGPPAATEQFNYGPGQPSMEAESSSLPPPPQQQQQQQQQQPEVGEQFNYGSSDPSLGHVSAPPPPMQQQQPAEQQPPQNVEIEGDQHNTQTQHDVLAQKEDQPQMEAGQEQSVNGNAAILNPMEQETAYDLQSHPPPHEAHVPDAAVFDQQAYQPSTQEDATVPVEQYTYDQQQYNQVDGVYYQEQAQYQYPTTEPATYEQMGASEVQSSQQEQEAQFDTGVPLHQQQQQQTMSPKSSTELQEIQGEQVVPNLYQGATAKPDDAYPSREPMLQQRSSMEQGGRVSMERTSTVYSAGSMLNRLASPQLEQFLPCPDPNCEGENKAKAKFCCECGRPLTSISRATTPAAGSVTSSVAAAHPPPLNEHVPPSSSASSYDPSSAAAMYGPPGTTTLQQQQQQQQPPSDMYYPEQQPYGAEQPATLMVGETSTEYYQNEAIPAAATDMYAQQQQQQLPPDPLNRARGCPLVSFGFGGKLCVMFPQTVQRFTTGYDAGAPITKTMPSAIQVRQLKDVLGDQDPMLRSLSDFVGPVLMDSKSSTKNKKKDALAYMDKRIADLTALLPSPDQPLEYNQAECRVLLWRLVRTLLEQEGTFNDGGKLDEATRALLQPTDLDANNDDQGDFSVPAYAQSNEATHGDDDAENAERSKKVLNKLETLLIKGDRAGAVEYAMQEDLWAHALILSSCVDKELWKKVVTSFVERDLSASAVNMPRQDRFNVRGDKQSLRVLYSLFAGSGVASVSEFMQASSPGHLMNTPFASSQPAQQRGNDEQLHEWRITLALILANRTPRDTEAITALGDVLRNHGWLDAAHICYLVSPQSSIHSGLDTPHVRMTLLGADGPNASHDIDAYFLTELFEFALSTKQNGAVSLPFLQGYKLMHAWWLADLGLLNLAQRYCESIASAVKGYTKGSPYLHRQLLESIREFNEVCEVASGHSLGGDTGSWLKNKLSKNSLDSLWGSLEGKFNKFVSGEDIPAEEPPARKSTEIMARPYDAVMDGPPARSASAFDFRNGRTSVGHEGIRRAATPTATMPSEGYSRRSSSPGARAGPFGHGFTPISQYPAPSDIQQQQQPDQQVPQQEENAMQQPGYGGYGAYGYGAPPTNAAMSPFGQVGSTPQYSPSMYDTQQQQYGATPAAAAAADQNGWYDQRHQSSYEPSPSEQEAVPSYEPPSNDYSAATPSYQNDEEDDDLGFGNSALKKSRSATPSSPPAGNENDGPEAPEKTQEASQENEQDKKDEGKGGWRIFSLFSRSSTPSEEKKAVKANLGEQNTFYYDEKEKRWVNKAAPSPAPAPALPPPPKASKPSTPAPPSATSTPPPPPPAASASPALSTMSGPPGGPASAGGGPPPPRSATSPPPPPSSTGARRAGGRKKPMRSRYVDVFNQPGN